MQLVVDRTTLARLRQASAVSFHYGASREGAVVSRIRVHAERHFGSVAVDLVTEYRCEATVVDFAGRDAHRPRDLPTPYRCFAYVGSARYDQRWSTICRSLRPGDRIELAWTGANDTGNHRKVGYHADELSLVAHRGTARYEYLVTYSVGPADSASMVRYDPGFYTEPRTAPHTDLAELAAAVDGVLSGRRRRQRVVVCVSEERALGLQHVECLVTGAGELFVDIVADAGRHDDHLVVISADRRQLLGAAYLPPWEVTACCAAAVTLYAELRDQGVDASRAADIAIAACSRAA